MVEFSATLSQLDGKRMMLKWSVLRRYSAFEKLVKDLGIVGLENIPSLPPKSWFRVDPRRRQAQLHTFLCKLLLVPGILSLPPLRKFLNITSEMASMLPGGSNRAGKKKRGRSWVYTEPVSCVRHVPSNCTEYYIIGQDHPLSLSLPLRKPSHAICLHSTLVVSICTKKKQSWWKRLQISGKFHPILGRKPPWVLHISLALPTIHRHHSVFQPVSRSVFK